MSLWRRQQLGNCGGCQTNDTTSMIFSGMKMPCPNDWFACCRQARVTSCSKKKKTSFARCSQWIRAVNAPHDHSKQLSSHRKTKKKKKTEIFIITVDAHLNYRFGQAVKNQIVNLYEWKKRSQGDCKSHIMLVGGRNEFGDQETQQQVLCPYIEWYDCITINHRIRFEWELNYFQPFISFSQNSALIHIWQSAVRIYSMLTRKYKVYIYWI